MASIEKRGQSYRITASDGLKADKSKNRERITWKPDPKWSEDRVQKELKKVADEFDAKFKNGNYLDGEKVSFAEFTERWLVDYADQQLKVKTRQEYRALLNNRILPAIGHHKLAKIKPNILIKFINQLQAPGQNQTQKFRALPDTREALKAAWKDLSDKKIDHQVLKALIDGQNVTFSTAEKVTKIQNERIEKESPEKQKVKIKDLFEPVGQAKELSANTVGHYLKCISSIMSTAVHWQIIESNPCERVKPPKVIQKKIKYLEIEESQKLLKAADNLADPRSKCAVFTFLYSGIRKGELAGLQWSDLDLKAGTLTINRTRQYIPGQGVVIGPPKSNDGDRLMSVSKELVSELKKYQTWQKKQRMKVGDKWQKKEREEWIKSAPNGQVRKEEDFQPVGWVFTNDFGYPLHPSTIYHWVKEFLVNNGHDEMTVHGLRHSNISLLLSQGVDIVTASKRAGHANPATTARIYAHAMRKPDEAAAVKLGSLLRPQMEDSV